MNLKPRKQRRAEQGAGFVPVPFYAGNGQCVEVQYHEVPTVGGSRWDKRQVRHRIDPDTCADWFVS